MSDWDGCLYLSLIVLPIVIICVARILDSTDKGTMPHRIASFVWCAVFLSPLWICLLVAFCAVVFK